MLWWERAVKCKMTSDYWLAMRTTFVVSIIKKFENMLTYDVMVRLAEIEDLNSYFGKKKKIKLYKLNE